MATETTAKKPRAKKRDFKKELTDLRQYCEIAIDVLHDTGVADTEHRIDTFTKILARIPE